MKLFRTRLPPYPAAFLVSLILVMRGLAAQAPAPANNEPAVDGPVRTNPVQVTAPRTADSAARRSISATVIKTADLSGGVGSLPEALEREASLSVRRYGGQGAYSTVSVRGSSPNQVNFYINGIPLNNAVSGEVNLADFNLDSFDSIEVYRSGDYPGAPIGGAVNLATRSREEQAEGVRLKAYGGSFGTFGLGAVAWGGELLQYDLAVKAERSDQNYRFRNDRGTTVLNTYDDFDDTRKNAQYQNIFGTVNLGFRAFDIDFSLLNDAALREQGVPGPGSAQSEKTEQHTLRNTSGIALDAKGLFFDAFRLKSQIYYTHYGTAFFDPRQEFATAETNQRARLQQYGWQLEPIVYLTEYFQTLRFFFSVGREIYKSDRRDRFDERVEKIPTRFRSACTARIEDEFSFLDERIVFIPAAEYQRYTDRFNDPETTRFNAAPLAAEKNVIEYGNYRASLRLVPYRTESTEFYLKGGASTGRRTPLFLELFGERGSVSGNSDLRPERSETVEGGVGAAYHGAQLQGELSFGGFRRLVRDMILFSPNSQFTLRPENVDAAEIRGAEIAGKLVAYDAVRFYGNYAYQEAINQSDVSFLKGKYLPLRPLHELNVGFRLYNDILEGGLEANYTGAVYRERTNDPASYQAGRWVYNASLAWTILGGKKDDDELKAGLEVKNILDERIADVINFPLPGRSVYATLSYRF